jgi:hypothetical protein
MMPKLVDNSFLLEEGFNQPINAVQFIQDYNSRTNEFTHSGEIPMGSKGHQFSYLVAQDQKINPILSYRFLSVSEPRVYLAHRFGVVVPVQDERYGFEYKQAFTFVASDRWMYHWNFGLFHFPRYKGETINSYNSGTSVVYYAQDNLNFLVEAYLETNQNQYRYIINPGLRYALNLDWQETQIVPGMSFPISFEQDTENAGVLLYLSFETKF